MKWTSKGKKKKYSITRFLKGFTYAFSGIKSALKTEKNILFEVIYGIITIVLGFLLKLSVIEFSIVLL